MQMNILNRELFELNERFSLVSQKDCSRHLDEIYSYASKIRDISKKVEDMVFVLNICDLRVSTSFNNRTMPKWTKTVKNYPTV